MKAMLPFSENAMLVMGPMCPGKLATLICSFKSQILIIQSSVPVPKMRPSGWNWAQVSAEMERLNKWNKNIYMHIVSKEFLINIFHYNKYYI